MTQDPNRSRSNPSRPLRVPPRSPDAGPNATDRITELAHELAHMLDGSLRWVTHPEQTLPTGEPMGTPSVSLQDTRKHLDRVRLTLESMSRVVDAAMRPVPLGSPLHRPGVGISLGEAIDHAVEVAQATRPDVPIEYEVMIDDSAGPNSAGPMYSVLLNTIMNAVESIDRCRPIGGDPVIGRIEVEAGVVTASGQRLLQLEVRDDGEGLPAETKDGRWAFEPGHSGKPGGSGLGLSLAKKTIEDAGGTITLSPRDERRGVAGRAGARLQIRLPIGQPEDTPIGGEGDS